MSTDVTIMIRTTENRQNTELVATFKDVHGELKLKGCQPKFLVLDSSAVALSRMKSTQNKQTYSLLNSTTILSCRGTSHQHAKYHTLACLAIFEQNFPIQV